MRRPQPRLAVGAAWSVDAEGQGPRTQGPGALGVAQGELCPEPSRALGTGRLLEVPGPCQIEKWDVGPGASLCEKGSRQIIPRDQVAKASRPFRKPGSLCAHGQGTQQGKVRQLPLHCFIAPPACT